MLIEDRLSLTQLPIGRCRIVHVSRRGQHMIVHDEPTVGSDAPRRWTTPLCLEEGVLTILERTHGQPVSYFVDELSFRMPDPKEAATLRLEPGVSVVRVVRIAYDGNDRPLEAFDQLLAGDKHILVYRVPA